MGIDIICSDDFRERIEQILLDNLCFYDDNSDICIVEKGYAIPDKGLAIIFTGEKFNEIEKIISALYRSENKPLRVIVGRINDKYEILDVSDIEYFEASDNKVFAVNQGRRYMIKSKLYELEEKLLNREFVRVSKSILVNITAIEEFVPWFAGKLLLKMKNKEEIDVTKSYANNFKKFIGMI